jgi:hypothetical protein
VQIEIKDGKVSIKTEIRKVLPKAGGQMNKVRKITAIAFTAFFFLILYSDGSVSGVRNNPNALRGVEEIDIMVQILDSHLKNSGFSPDQIKTDIESKLRMAGIKVSPDALPTLYVDINSYEDPKCPGVVIITVRLDLYQFVYLPPPKEILWTSTWYTDSFTILGAANVSGVRDLVKDHVDKFINDYLSVNPKR